MMMITKLSHFNSAWKLAAGTIVALLVSVQIKDAPVGFVDTNGSSSDSSGQCLDLDSNQDMDSLVANARQIFITMPAKAGGTSMKDFTKLCMKRAVHGNILSREGLWKDYLVDSLHVQSIIASHLYREADFLRLVNSPSRETLMIHIHREESSRVASAVKHFSVKICEFRGKYSSHQKQTVAVATKFNVRKNNTHCILDEESFVNEIAANSAEVGISTHRLLTCQSYKAIQENAPQLVFLHYKQVDKLQKLLAKHHCPELLAELPIRANMAEDKSLKVLLHKKGTDEARNSVDLEEWLHAKGPAMEWTLKLRREASCQAKTFHMEDELFACPDETLRVTSASIDRW
mmetsp:Transcript_16243/g.27438  ORF Transcript_16243/g.27438 Transcript_16243/m.27438 type:complete len:346 (-) Transcript_16243:49-1086(-)